jgi:hypothetical protein
MNSANHHQSVSRRKGTSVLGLAILGTLFAAFLALAWNRCSQPALTDYRGVIVDRWAGYTASEQGGKPYFRLLIERDNQQRITVNVDAETYHQLQVGMNVVSRNGQIDLKDPQTKPDD